MTGELRYEPREPMEFDLETLASQTPTLEELDARCADEPAFRRDLPVTERGLRPPFEVRRDEDGAPIVAFECYSAELPLYEQNVSCYQQLCRWMEENQIRTLALTDVTSKRFEWVRWLGDPVAYVANHGLPASVRDVRFLHNEPMTHAGDVGPARCEPLRIAEDALQHIERITIGGSSSWAKLALPQLRRLEVLAWTDAAALKGLAKAQLPALEELSLSVGTYVEPELRWKAAKALFAKLRSPSLRTLTLRWLDPQDFEVDELVEEDDSHTGEESFVEMLARSPYAKTLRHLDLWFNMGHEAEKMIEHIGRFKALETLAWEDKPKVKLPTDIAAYVTTATRR